MTDGLVYERGRDDEGWHRLDIEVARRSLERVFVNLVEWLQPADGIEVHLYGGDEEIDDEVDEPEVLLSPPGWEAAAIARLLRERGRDLILHERVGLRISYRLCGAVLRLRPDKRLVLLAHDDLVIVTFERKLASMKGSASLGLTPRFGNRSVEAWHAELRGHGFRLVQPPRPRSLFEALREALAPFRPPR